MRTGDDESLRAFRAMAEGDHAALSRLIARHGRAITVFAGRALNDPAQGEDVAQEVFLRAWERAGRFDPARGSPEAWLYGIAANLCRDRMRRARLRRFFGGPRPETMDEHLADDAPPTEDRVAGRERLARVRAAIAHLPERQRMAILLTAVAGLDTPAVAAALGASRGSVEQLLVRARRHLRTVAGEDMDTGNGSEV